MSLKKLKSYDLLAKIGHGGMGEVYRARDGRLGRDIAIKVLPDQVAKSSERRKRFEREAKMVAALSHPNIVTIHSVENDEGTPFITMELVQGLTLDQLIPANGLPLDQFFDHAIPLADAVSYAHRRGITHRDLKPGNIMIDDEGRLKVLDFGLAKLLQTESPDEARTLEMSDSVTGEGRVLGTAAYMSPEQAEGKPIDHRSDIFSLGIVLYEMATGKRPFYGDSKMSTISAIILKEPSPVTQLRQALPRHLGRIIRKCLQKKADRRYQSAVDLRNDLQELREELNSGEVETAGGAAAATPGRSSWLKGALAMAILVLMGFGVLRIVGGERRDNGASVSAPTTANLVTSTGSVRAVSISPDGRYIAYAAQEGDAQSLHIKQLSTGSDVQILSLTRSVIRSLKMSPDGQHVYFESGELSEGGIFTFGIYQIPILGGTPRRMVENVRGDFALSPDGEKVAFFRPEGGEYTLMVAATDGSGEDVVGGFGSSTAFRNGLAWSPSGDHILTTREIKDPGFTWVLVEIDASDGHEIQASTSRWTAIKGMAWLPDGKIIIAGLRGRQRFQDTIRFWQLFALQDEARVLFGDAAEYSGVSVDQSGNTLASVAMMSDQSVWIVPERGSGSPRKIDYTSQVGNWFVQLAWIDAGILVEYREGEEMHIRYLSADGTKSRLVTTEGPSNMGPAVSPRGDRIAYFSNRSGSMKVYVADPSGANSRRLTGEEFEEFFPAFNDAGDSIFYHAIDPADGSWILRKAPVSGGSSVFIADGLGFPQTSPNGNRLLVSSLDQACNPCVAILPIDGGDPEFLKLEYTAWRPRWYPDGSALTVERHENEEGSVWVVPLDDSPPRQLARFPNEEVHSIAWSHGGDSLAVATRRRSGDVVLLRNTSAY